MRADAAQGVGPPLVSLSCKRLHALLHFLHYLRFPLFVTRQAIWGAVHEQKSRRTTDGTWEHTSSRFDAIRARISSADRVGNSRVVG